MLQQLRRPLFTTSLDRVVEHEVVPGSRFDSVREAFQFTTRLRHMDFYFKPLYTNGANMPISSYDIFDTEKKIDEFGLTTWGAYREVFISLPAHSKIAEAQRIASIAPYVRRVGSLDCPARLFWRRFNRLSNEYLSNPSDTRTMMDLVFVWSVALVFTKIRLFNSVLALKYLSDAFDFEHDTSKYLSTYVACDCQSMVFENEDTRLLKSNAVASDFNATGSLILTDSNITFIDEFLANLSSPIKTSPPPSSPRQAGNKVEVLTDEYELCSVAGGHQAYLDCKCSTCKNCHRCIKVRDVGYHNDDNWEAHVGPNVAKKFIQTKEWSRITRILHLSCTCKQPAIELPTFEDNHPIMLHSLIVNNADGQHPKSINYKVVDVFYDAAGVAMTVRVTNVVDLLIALGWNLTDAGLPTPYEPNNLNSVAIKAAVFIFEDPSMRMLLRFKLHANDGAVHMLPLWCPVIPLDYKVYNPDVNNIHYNGKIDIKLFVRTGVNLHSTYPVLALSSAHFHNQNQGVDDTPDLSDMLQRALQSAVEYMPRSYVSHSIASMYGQTNLMRYGDKNDLLLHPSGPGPATYLFYTNSIFTHTPSVCTSINSKPVEYARKRWGVPGVSLYELEDWVSMKIAKLSAPAMYKPGLLTLFGFILADDGPLHTRLIEVHNWTPGKPSMSILFETSNGLKILRGVNKKDFLSKGDKYKAANFIKELLSKNPIDIFERIGSPSIGTEYSVRGTVAALTRGSNIGQVYMSNRVRLVQSGLPGLQLLDDAISATRRERMSSLFDHDYNVLRPFKRPNVIDSLLRIPHGGQVPKFMTLIVIPNSVSSVTGHPHRIFRFPGLDFAMHMCNYCNTLYNDKASADTCQSIYEASRYYPTSVDGQLRSVLFNSLLRGDIGDQNPNTIVTSRLRFGQLYRFHSVDPGKFSFEVATTLMPRVDYPSTDQAPFVHAIDLLENAIPNVLVFC